MDIVSSIRLNPAKAPRKNYRVLVNPSRPFLTIRSPDCPELSRRSMACLLLLLRSTKYRKEVLTVEADNTDRSINLLTMSEAASLLKISQKTLHRMIQKGRIPAFKIGNQWRFLESRIEEWIQER
jgi:excisionase family DNA binding protein